MARLTPLPLPGGRSVRPELLPVRPLGSAVLLPGRVAGAGVRSVRLRLRNPRGEGRRGDLAAAGDLTEPVSADQDHPERLHHPGLPGEMDPAGQDGDPGPGGVVGPQSGEGGPSGPRGLLLRKPLLQPVFQVQQERREAPRGARPSSASSMSRGHSIDGALTFDLTGPVGRCGGWSVGGFWGTHRRSPLQSGGGRVAVPPPATWGRRGRSC